MNTTDTVTDETLTRAVSIAREVGVGMHAHVSQSPTEVAFSVATRRRTPIQYLHDIGALEVNLAAAHATAVTDEDVRLLARSSAFVAHSPISNAKGAGVMAPIPALMELGGAVALGTDAAPSDMLEVVRHTSALHKLYARSTDVMPADVCLRLATIDGARAIGRGDELGSLEPGKLADIVLIDMDRPHLQPDIDLMRTVVYNARGSDVSTVMVGVDVVVEDGRSTRVDEYVVVQSARIAASQLWRRQSLDVHR